MVTIPVERVAALEAKLDNVKADIQELEAEMNRTRGRLHNLEGLAQATIDVQKAHRRSEQKQYQRMGTMIALAGVFMSAAMVALTIVTLIYHA